MSLAILRRLGLGAEPQSPLERGLLESLEARLSSLAPARAAWVAAFAGLLARVACADDEISELEARRIGDLVAEHAGLDTEEAEAVALIARSKTVALRGVENHLLTRRFNEVAAEEDKRRLIECLYAVATADDLVTYVEDREVKQIAAALMLSQAELLAIRSRYRDKLEELRELRKLRGEKH